MSIAGTPFNSNSLQAFALYFTRSPVIPNEGSWQLPLGPGDSYSGCEQLVDMIKRGDDFAPDDKFFEVSAVEQLLIL
jgi:hypothetical protein